MTGHRFASQVHDAISHGDLPDAAMPSDCDRSCSSTSSGIPPVTPLGSYRAERVAAQRAPTRAPRTMSQERAVASRAALLEKPAAVPLCSRALRPSPWSSVARPPVIDVSPAAAPPPSPATTPKTQKARDSSARSSKAEGDAAERLGPPVDGIGRHTATPQKRCLQKSASHADGMRSSTSSLSPRSRKQYGTHASTSNLSSCSPSAASSPRSSSFKPLNRATSSSDIMGRGPRAHSSSRPTSAASARRKDNSRSISASRRTGRSVEREQWDAAPLCWETLWLLGPLHENLRTCLGQPKRPLGSCVSERRAAGTVPPSACPPTRDTRKLADNVASMMTALSNLAARLRDESAPPAAIDHQPPVAEPAKPEPPSVEELVRSAEAEAERLHLQAQLEAERAKLTAQLDTERTRLKAREAQLQASAVEAADLENIVRQLRSRVSDLESRESKVMDLRSECSTLRSRLAELIGSTIDYSSLEKERADLAFKIQRQTQALEQTNSQLQVKDIDGISCPILPESLQISGISCEGTAA